MSEWLFMFIISNYDFWSVRVCYFSPHMCVCVLEGAVDFFQPLKNSRRQQEKQPHKLTLFCVARVERVGGWWGFDFSFEFGNNNLLPSFFSNAGTLKQSSSSSSPSHTRKMIKNRTTTAFSSPNVCVEWLRVDAFEGWNETKASSPENSNFVFDCLSYFPLLHVVVVFCGTFPHLYIIPLFLLECFFFMCPHSRFWYYFQFSSHHPLLYENSTFQPTNLEGGTRHRAFVVWLFYTINIWMSFHIPHFKNWNRSDCEVRKTSFPPKLLTTTARRSDSDP